MGRGELARLFLSDWTITPQICRDPGRRRPLSLQEVFPRSGRDRFLYSRHAAVNGLALKGVCT
jgi:hypothetical protein